MAINSHKTGGDVDDITPITPQANRQVYIVDDDADVRKSLHFLLASSSITAWPFAAAADFFEHLPELVPAPILLDVRMPDIDGLKMLEMLNDREVNWPVVVITAYGDVTVAVRAMKLGAIDFIEKPFQPEMLDQVLKLAFNRLDHAQTAARAAADARRALRLLTAREREVAMILLEGAANKVVAQRLNLSPRTVEMHRSNAFTKLGVKGVAELMTLVVAAGVDLPPGLPGSRSD